MRKDQVASPKRSIMLGTTSPISLGFLSGFPEYLNSCGWVVHIVSSNGPELAKYEGSQQVEMHSIEMQRDPDPLNDIKALIEWVQLIRRIRPSIVVAGTPKAGMLATVAARMTSIPVRVYHLWGLRVETTKGPLRVVLKFTEWLTCWSATRVLLVSPSLGQAVLKSRLAPESKLDLLGPGSSNGIDLEYFNPSRIPIDTVNQLRRDLGIEASEFVVGYVGRIHPDKGLSFLTDAMTALVESNSIKAECGTKVRLLVVGDVDQTNYNPFSGVTFPVSIVGQVRDTRPYYRMMNALCLPSLREGLPNVPLEAAAMGVPVLTTTATGARDSVKDGVSGRLVPARDSLALEQAIEDLITNPETAREMGAQGQEWVRRFERREVWRMQEHYFAALLENPDNTPQDVERHRL